MIYYFEEAYFILPWKLNLELKNIYLITVKKPEIKKNYPLVAI